MENKPILCGELPDDPSLIDLITSKEGEKIKRPPNSFLVFAKYHRKEFAKKYPDISNKDISTLLGKEWKSTPEETKRFYIDKAHELAMLHSQMHPDYAYSPLVARQRKRTRVKNKNATFLNALNAGVANLKKEEPEKNSETANAQSFVCYQELPATSSYVPNNPQYNLLPNAEMPEDENDERRPQTDYVSENQPTVSNSTGYIAPRQYELEPSVRSINQHRMQMAPPGVPRNLQFLRQTPSVCSLNKNNPDSRSCASYGPAPYYNRVPEGVSSPYYQYWKPQAMSQPLYYQSMEDNPMKSFCYGAPPYPSEYYRPSPGCVGNGWPYCRQSDLERSPHINVDTTRSHEFENQFEIQNTETGNFVRKGRVAETVSSQNYGLEEKQFPHKRMHLEPSYKTTGYKPSFIQRQTKEEMPNCSSHASHLLEIGKNKCETTSECAESFANNNNFLSSSISENQEHNDLRNLSENDLSMPQIISYSSLNEELPRMRVLVSQPKQEPAENFDEVLSPDLGNFHQHTAYPNYEQELNLELKENIINYDLNSGAEAETTETKYYGVQDTLDRNMESNECLNYPANYSIASNTFYGQANDMEDSNEDSEDTEDSIEVM